MMIPKFMHEATMEGEELLNAINLENPGFLDIAIIIVAVLICLVAIGSVGVSLYLAIKYVRFNRTNNKAGMTGEQVARKLLDANGLNKIKVSKNGSLLFGNSYSHYFHKVRLRRLTWKKTSITSLAMGAQKTGLAVLDKEGDEDMKSRIALTPLITFGPFAFIPLILIGIILDIFVFAGATLLCTLIASGLGIALLVLSFVLQFNTLKTEIKAQEKAYEMLRANDLATEEEIAMMKELFKLYNIEYINNIILAFLEVIYRILMIALNVRNATSSSNND